MRVVSTSYTPESMVGSEKVVVKSLFGHEMVFSLGSDWREETSPCGQGILKQEV